MGSLGSTFFALFFFFRAGFRSAVLGAPGFAAGSEGGTTPERHEEPGASTPANRSSGKRGGGIIAAVSQAGWPRLGTLSEGAWR